MKQVNQALAIFSVGLPITMHLQHMLQQLKKQALIFTLIFRN